MSAGSVPINLHLAVTESLFPKSGSQSHSSVDEVEPLEANTAYEIFNLDEAQPMKVDSTVLRGRVTSDNDGKSLPIRNFSQKNYEWVGIVAYQDQITKVPYWLQKVPDEHRKKLRICLDCDGFGYIRGVLIVMLHFA